MSFSTTVTIEGSCLHFDIDYQIERCDDNKVTKRWIHCVPSPASPHGWNRPSLPRRCPSGPQPGPPRSYLQTFTSHHLTGHPITKTDLNASQPRCKHGLECALRIMNEYYKWAAASKQDNKHSKERGGGGWDEPKLAQQSDGAFSEIGKTVKLKIEASSQRRCYWLITGGTTGGQTGCGMSGLSTVSSPETLMRVSFSLPWQLKLKIWSRLRSFQWCLHSQLDPSCKISSQ